MSFITISKCFVLVTVLLFARRPLAMKTVTTKTGDVRGSILKQGDTSIYAYLGIPYAEPPIGEMRFKAPTPIKPWRGVYEATKLPPSCLQDPPDPSYEWQAIDRDSFKEDCLYLNIWVPVKGINDGKKAVMVWIHGGGFNTGSSSLDIYDGKILAARGNVIVVTLNYRLGAFGFFYSGTEDAPGNMAMKDQVMAMKWVKDNIEAFGGDPSRITLFGESAGSLSVSTHLISPLTNGIFSRAILESGSAYQPAFYPGRSEAFALSNRLANSLGCIKENQNITTHPSEVVSCMKNLSATDIAASERRKMVGPTTISFLPLHGDNYLPVQPLKAFSDGNIHNVEIMIGTVRDEGSFFLAFLDPSVLQEDQLMISEAQAAKYIETVYQQVTNPPTSVIVDYYLKNVSRDNILKRTYDSIGDWLLYCPTVYLSGSFASHGMNSYHYVFSHRRRVAPFKEWFGVPHFEDVPFVFGTHLSLNNTNTPKDLQFSNSVIDTWTSFANTGKPTSHLLGKEWPIYSKENPVAVQLNPDNTKIINPYKEECEFWKPYF